MDFIYLATVLTFGVALWGLIEGMEKLGEKKS